jgi:hypothetical protein
MINYAKILSEKEKDNPSPFCRTSYLISNAAQVIHCYGRTLRFGPEGYNAEMRCALGDTIIQTLLLARENCMTHNEISDILEETKLVINDEYYAPLMKNSTTEELLHHVFDVISDVIKTSQKSIESQIKIEMLLGALFDVSTKMEWNFDDVMHEGFQHTIERFEQFNREGWK